MSIVTDIVGGLLSGVGKLLLSLMVKIPKAAETTQAGSEEQSYHWEAYEENPKLNTVIPKRYGRDRSLPSVFYRELMDSINGNSVIELGFMVGTGPIPGFTGADIWLGENLNYMEYQSEVKQCNIFYGYADQDADVADWTDGDGVSMMKDPAPAEIINAVIPESGSAQGGTGSQIPVWKVDRTEDDPAATVIGQDPPQGSVELTPQAIASPNLTHQVENNGVALYCGLLMPGCYKTDAQGQLLAHDVTISFYYKLRTDSLWTPARRVQYTDQRSRTLRWQVKIAEGLDPTADYDVAWVNENDVLPEDPVANGGISYVDEVQVEYVKMMDRRKINYRGWAFVELRLEANSQISGKIPAVTIENGGQQIKVYSDAQGTYSEAVSDNAIQCFIDAALSHRDDGGMGISLDRIDLPSALTAAAFQTTMGFKFQYTFDKERPWPEVVQIFRDASMCWIDDIGGKYYFRPRQARTVDPADVLTVHTDFALEVFTRERIVKTSQINAVLVEFKNAEKGHKTDQLPLIVHQPSVDAAGGRIECKKMSLLAVQQEDQALKIGKLMLNEVVLTEFVASLGTGPLASNFTRNDLIGITDSELTDWTARPMRITDFGLSSKMEISMSLVDEPAGLYEFGDTIVLPPDVPVPLVSAAPVTNLDASLSLVQDDDGFSYYRVNLTWLKPADSNYVGAEIWAWPENGLWQKVPGGYSTGTAFDVQVDDGLQYTFAVRAVSKDGLIEALKDAPKKAITVPFVNPPDVSFDPGSCRYDGPSVLAAVVPVANFTGTYEIRTSNPANWDVDDSGYLGRSPSVTQVYAVPVADSITLYVKGRTLEGRYSTNAGSVALQKAADSPVLLPSLLDSMSRNLIINAAFLNVYTGTSGRRRFRGWVGDGYTVGQFPDGQEANHGVGPYYLIKDTQSEGPWQDIIIDIPTAGDQNYALQYLAAWNEVGSVMHDSPIVKLRYFNASGVEISTQTFTGETAVSGWELNTHVATVPINTQTIRVIIYGDALYDAIQLSRGDVHWPFDLHAADQVDGIDQALEREAMRAYISRLGGDMRDIRQQLEDVADFWTEMNYNSAVMRTKAFLIQARGIELLVGDLDTASGRITILEGRIVLAVKADGYMATLALGTNQYGSNISIKADQLQITALTTFLSGDNLTDTINEGPSYATIDGPKITANTFLARVGFAGALLEIDSGADSVWRAASSEYITPRAVFGATAASADNTAERCEIAMTGALHIGAKLFADAPFSVTPGGIMTAVGAILETADIYGTCNLWDTAKPRVYDSELGSDHLYFLWNNPAGAKTYQHIQMGFIGTSDAPIVEVTNGITGVSGLYGTHISAPQAVLTEVIFDQSGGSYNNSIYEGADGKLYHKDGNGIAHEIAYA